MTSVVRFSVVFFVCFLVYTSYVHCGSSTNIHGVSSTPSESSSNYGSGIAQTVISAATKEKKYSLGTKELGWISAWMECKKENKLFASIKTQEEQTKVEELLKPRSGSKKPSASSELRQYWLGARYNSTQKNFVWTGQEFNDITPLTFTNWATTISRDQVKNGRCVLSNRQGVWDSEYCHERKYYICEYH